MKILVAHHTALLGAGIIATLQAIDGFEVCLPDESRPLADSVRGADIAITDHATAIALVGRQGVQPNRLLIICHSVGEAEIREALGLGIRGILQCQCGAGELVDAIRKLQRGQTAIDATVADHIAESLNWQPLTAREQAVMRELLSGCRNQTIADRLNISLDTARSHVKNILGKLGASNRVEAVAIAQRRGLLHLEA